MFAETLSDVSFLPRLRSQSCFTIHIVMGYYRKRALIYDSIVRFVISVEYIINVNACAFILGSHLFQQVPAYRVANILNT